MTTTETSEVGEPIAAEVRGHGRGAFAFVFATAALDLLAVGVVIPVLPKLIKQLEGGDLARASAITGVFGFTWAAMQFVFAPVLGALSDRFGRRPVILASNLGLGLDYVLMALAPTLPWLWVGRVVSGITAASYPTACAYVADVTPPEKRAAKFGQLGGAFAFGFIVGPALGGFLGGIDLRLPFWAAAGLSLANAAYGAFILPESLPAERRKAFAWKMASPLGAMKLLRSGGLAGLASASLLYFLAHESLPSIYVLYTDFRYQWGERLVGASLALIGLCSGIVSVVLTGAVVKRIGERATVLLGLVFGTIGFALFGLAPTGAVFFAGLPFLSLWGLSGPAMQSLMSARVDPSAQGQLQGAVTSLRGVTGMIGPLVFTQMLALTIAAPGAHLPGAPYLFAAALIVASLGIAALVTRAKAPRT